MNRLSDIRAAAAHIANRPHRTTDSVNFDLWDIVTRDGTDQQLVYNITPQQLHMVCIKPSECDCMKDDNWIIGETESNVPWRYTLISKCLTPEKLLKQIGRDDLWKSTSPVIPTVKNKRYC